MAFQEKGGLVTEAPMMCTNQIVGSCPSVYRVRGAAVCLVKRLPAPAP
jgi:hypothetical protein